MRHHAYVVKWIDSSTLRGWRSIDDEQHDTAVITSIGWVVKMTAKVVTMTTAISECGNVVDAISIPRAAVIKMVKLKNCVEGG